MSAAIDAVILLLVLGTAYAIFSEGLWGATLIFFNVAFASLLAFSCYEPAAGFIAEKIPDVAGFADTFCLMLFFLIGLILMRVATGSLAPKLLRFPPPVKLLFGLIMGLATGILTVGFILVCFHTAPVHKKLFTTVGADTAPPFGLGLDHKWLGFFALSSDRAFGRDNPEHAFTSPEQWLAGHEKARPYGEAETPAAPAPAGAPAAAPAGAPAGAPPAMPGMPPSVPGMP